MRDPVTPKTGTVYHLEFNPPPAGVEVTQRGDDTAEAIKVRLAHFHKNVAEVLQSYRSATVRVDGNRDKGDVFADIEKAIDRQLIE